MAATRLGWSPKGAVEEAGDFAEAAFEKVRLGEEGVGLFGVDVELG